MARSFVKMPIYFLISACSCIHSAMNVFIIDLRFGLERTWTKSLERFKNITHFNSDPAGYCHWIYLNAELNLWKLFGAKGRKTGRISFYLALNLKLTTNFFILPLESFTLYQFFKLESNFYVWRMDSTYLLENNNMTYKISIII